MFKKLISNLPFNPSLIGQVSFYSKRIHNEAKLRSLGFMLLVLALIIQLFAVVTPPQSTLAVSDNDLLRGGFSSKIQAVNDCNNNTQGYKVILEYFGINCADVNNTTVNPNLRSTDYNRQLYSMGRNAYGKAGETPVLIKGSTFYMRYLWSWDKSSPSSYQALVGKTSKGLTFMLLFNCGNLVIIGAPKPPLPIDVCSNLPGIQTDKKQCDVCAGLAGIQTTLQQCDVCKNVGGIQTKLEDCDVCPNIAGIQLDKAQCIPCKEAQTNVDNLACVDKSKGAENLTQHIPNADGTTAKAGDTIVYTLRATNIGKSTVKSFIMEEDLTDVLEYATVSDAHGGTFNPNTKSVSWPALDLAPNQTTQNQITIQVKQSIPKTPQSTSNPGSFDLVMTNVYGNAINIKLPKSIAKTTETVSKTLPNTGPGSSATMAFILTSVVGYFFARSRLLAKELDIIKEDFVSSGGA